VRTISALLQSTAGNVSIFPPQILSVGVSNTRTSSDRSTADVDDHNLASRVVDVSARIMAHTIPDDGEDEEVDELVDELEGDGEEEGGGEGEKGVRDVVEVKDWDEGDESDTFSVPLRRRTGREEVTVNAAVAH
jgi:hypothetical protein